MAGRKPRPLDPLRSNTLPRYLTEENMPSPEKDAQKFLSSSLNRVDRDEIKRLIKPNEGNPENTSALGRIEEKRRLELEKRKAHQTAIYSMDLAALDDTFHLPGKPDPRSTLPADFVRKSPRKPTKLAAPRATEGPEEEVAENTGFLPGLLGMCCSYFITNIYNLKF